MIKEDEFCTRIFILQNHSQEVSLCLYHYKHAGNVTSDKAEGGMPVDPLAARYIQNNSCSQT